MPRPQEGAQAREEAHWRRLQSGLPRERGVAVPFYKWGPDVGPEASAVWKQRGSFNPCTGLSSAEGNPTAPLSSGKRRTVQY